MEEYLIGRQPHWKPYMTLACLASKQKASTQQARSKYAASMKQARSKQAASKQQANIWNTALGLSAVPIPQGQNFTFWIKRFLHFIFPIKKMPLSGLGSCEKLY